MDQYNVDPRTANSSSGILCSECAKMIPRPDSSKGKASSHRPSSEISLSFEGILILMDGGNLATISFTTDEYSSTHSLS